MATELYFTTKSPEARMLGAQVSGVFDAYNERRSHGQWQWTFLLDDDATDGGAIQSATLEDTTSLAVAGTTSRMQFPRSTSQTEPFRWCTRPLSAQTISGTFDLLLGAGRTSGTGTRAAYWKIYIYITVGDTPVVRHVLLDYEDSTNTIPAGTIIFDALDSAQTLTTGNAEAGDRVMVVLGVRYQGTTTVPNIPTTQVFFGTQLGATGSPGSNGTLSGTSVTTQKGFATFSHTFSFLSTPAPPANDACVDAVTITSIPFEYEVSASHSADTSRAVWFTWTADASGVVILNTLGSNYRAGLAVFTGSCGSLTPVSLSGTADRQQWIQSSQTMVQFTATASTQYWIRVTSVTFSLCARNSGGWLRLQLVRQQSIQPNDLIVNGQHIAVYRNGTLINFTDKFYGFTPTGSSIDRSLRPIKSLIDDSIHTSPRLVLVLFGFDLIEYLDLQTLNHLDFAELTYIPIWDAPGYSGQHLSSIVWDTDGNIYTGFFGDNYSHLGNPPSNAQTAWIHKWDGAITTTNYPGDEVSLLARYDIALQNQGSDYIELSSDQRTMFYTSAGTSIKRYDVVDDVQLSDFASVANASGPRPGLRGLRLLPPGDGSAGLLATNGSVVHRLNSSGTIIQTYTPAEALIAQDLDKIELNNTATQFYVTDQMSSTVFHFNLSTGAQLGTYPLYLPQGQICGFSSNEGYRAGVPTIGPPVEFPETGPPDQSVLCPCPEPPSSTTPTGGTPILLPALPEPVLCGGGGLVPTAADLTDSEIWWGL